MSKFIEYKRVLQKTHKPNFDEYMKIFYITLLGIGIVGFIGFIVMLLYNSIF